MSFQIMLNFFIAFLWMFLTVSFNASTFVVGFLLGAMMLWITKGFFPGRFYMNRVWAVIKLILLFFKELILANIQVLLLIVQPKMPIKPAIFALPTVLEKDWEITLLSNLITLTPGTLVIDVSEDSKTLYIHAIDYGDADDAINSIKNTFEKAIQEVSR
ncbi:Na+/H+ antiporter subunit E [Paenisporosarcina sp. OV554]|uniref:Na+/H+ antiporter subunit E n=1 Tax=Paenisporosarcina sp. OV554 TaxID=2135694 RepID=UPI000D344551|nr:Na+/H+ antiporter subunit E [Paenisporosarcina sp. OV554]PUB15814.1 multisubunit sodium/proton antiporter MrpE subunit [Paenisporosarcina sp. OV554]